MNILVTGDRGFIGGYLVKRLLDDGHRVFGIDNCSKYGEITRSYDNDPNYVKFNVDANDLQSLKEIIVMFDIEQIIANAAMIGGISYFHDNAYDLIAENERITAATFDASIHGYRHGILKKINVISSSMVYESECVPYHEDNLKMLPKSTYGFQKLSTEYFAKGAFLQHGLPYTIIRPFNCVGAGEYDAIVSGENANLALSHVVPDLVRKVLLGMNPVPIYGDGKQIRCYTYGGDIAEGILRCVNHYKNDCFNISTSVSTDVMSLLEMIWVLCEKKDILIVEHLKPFEYDVQERIPDVSKAKSILGFEAKTPLETSLKEVIAWMKEHLNK